MLNIETSKMTTTEQIEYFNNQCSKIVKLANNIFNLNLDYEQIELEEPQTFNSWYSAYEREATEQIRDKFYELFNQLSNSHITRPAAPFATTQYIFNTLDNTLTKLQKY